MQNLTGLSTEDIELIRIAGEHAKSRFKKEFISIGSALRTKNGKIFTGINLKVTKVTLAHKKIQVP